MGGKVKGETRRKAKVTEGVKERRRKVRVTGRRGSLESERGDLKELISDGGEVSD